MSTVKKICANCALYNSLGCPYSGDKVNPAYDGGECDEFRLMTKDEFFDNYCMYCEKEGCRNVLSKQTRDYEQCSEYREKCLGEIRTYNDLVDEAIVRASEDLDECEEPFSDEINELPFGAYAYIERETIKEFCKILLKNCKNSPSDSYNRRDIEDTEIIRLAKEHFGVKIEKNEKE